ncbi:MAG: class I SAM-dependent methyltransferase family protein [Candidatus Hodarchaeota archaeon]
MRFKENLKEKLEGIISEDELNFLPRGFQTIGKVMILKLNPELLYKKKIIAEKCLDLLPSIRSVFLNTGKITGQFRTPEKIEYLAGEDNPIVEHKEHNVIYRFDITKIMFSKGNVNERRHLTTLIKNNEVIVDMFAGIGYFSLPIAVHTKPKKIYSIELNPDSYKFLYENIKLNHVDDIVVPINGDCKEEVIKLNKKGISADRVIMGVFPAPKDYIQNGLTLLKQKGTIFHYEGVREKENYLSLFEEFKEIADRENINCELLSYRFVKSYGPNLYHIVVDIFAKRK